MNITQGRILFYNTGRHQRFFTLELGNEGHLLSISKFLGELPNYDHHDVAAALRSMAAELDRQALK